MRKLLLVVLILLALPVLGIGALLVSGTIDTSSLRMALNVMTGLGGPKASEAGVRQRLSVPPGFSLSLYAADLPRVRMLRATPAGDLIASRPHAGDVILLRRDANGDGQPDGIDTLIDNLRRPHGLDLHEGWLYIAESHRVIRLAFDSASGQISGNPEVVVDGLSDNGNHWSKTLGFGPDGLLYLAQGSTCNVCVEEDERRATMMRFAADGSDGEIIAIGLRNSVGFDWAPWNDGLYATDNGRDLLGDDFPPCELNRIESGHFYGWPWFNGDNVPDPDITTNLPKAEPVPPVHNFRAHNAPLGITFPDTGDWPGGRERVALVALHGSWNRSSPDGYKVVSLHWTEQGIEERDFLWGFLRDGEISGRPADIAQGTDGALYVSDDYAGAIYRITASDEGSTTLAIAPESDNTTDTDLQLSADEQSSLLTMGEKLYRDNNCAECHESGQNPHLLDDLSSRRNLAQVVEALSAPQAPMPVYPFSKQEQRALALYLLR